MPSYTVKFLWDNEAMVWVATSDDIPGLVLESGSFDALAERLRYVIPELLSLNGNNEKQFAFAIKSERYELVSV